MDLDNVQNQNLEESEQDNFWTARFVKFLGVFLGIIGLVSGGYWIWFNYYSATARMQANYERYENWQEEGVVPYSDSMTKEEVQPMCHPSYSGCLDLYASDYDCLGGSGNGPRYTDTVRVIGPDVFGLDRDGNGWGCE